MGGLAVFDPLRRRFLFLTASFIGLRAAPALAQTPATGASDESKTNRPLCSQSLSIPADDQSAGAWRIRVALYERNGDGSWPTKDEFHWRSRSVSRSHFDSISFTFNRNKDQILGADIVASTNHAFKRADPISTLKTGLFRLDVGEEPLVSENVRSTSKREPPLDDGAIPLSNETTLKLAPSEARRLWQALTSQGNVKAYVMIPAEDGSGTLGAYIATIDTIPLTGAGERIEALKNQAVDMAHGETCRPLSSGCYLTTTCCSVAGLSDDCFELRTLRKFRDTWLSHQPGGHNDIDAYYRVAPDLSRRLHISADRLRIARALYIRYIIPCVLMIKLGMPTQAWRHYRRLAEFTDRVLA